MAYICPLCSNGTLNRVLRLELAADCRSDEIAVQIIKCATCPFEGVAIYEESRRGALDSESFEYTGFFVAQDELDRLTGLIHACPDPTNRHCTCATHRSLGRRSDSGRWSPVIGLGEPFPMRD